jgi:hypothetical protein
MAGLEGHARDALRRGGMSNWIGPYSTLTRGCIEIHPSDSSESFWSGQAIAELLNGLLRLTAKIKSIPMICIIGNILRVVIE